MTFRKVSMSIRELINIVKKEGSGELTFATKKGYIDVRLSVSDKPGLFIYDDLTNDIQCYCTDVEFALLAIKLLEV